MSRVLTSVLIGASFLAVPSAAFATVCSNVGGDVACHGVNSGEQGGCLSGSQCILVNPGTNCICAPPGVPTVSDWGVALMTMLVVAAGSIVLRRRSEAVRA